MGLNYCTWTTKDFFWYIETALFQILQHFFQKHKTQWNNFINASPQYHTKATKTKKLSVVTFTGEKITINILFWWTLTTWSTNFQVYRKICLVKRLLYIENPILYSLFSLNEHTQYISQKVYLKLIFWVLSNKWFHIHMKCTTYSLSNSTTTVTIGL